MIKLLKALLLMLPLIVGAVLLSTNIFYGYDHFTANPDNDGALPRGALQHYANPNVPFILDSNPPNMGSRTAMELVTTAFSRWTNVPTATINATISGTQDFTLSDVLGLDVSEGSGPLMTNGVNEVLNVDTKTMADSLGFEEGLLGVGIARVNINSGAIFEGLLIMVTAFGEGGSDYESTAVHELGHVMGLMHTPITRTSTILDETLVPTMYFAALSDDRHGRTLEPDDIASISEAYPEPSFQTTFGAISGRIKDQQNQSVFGAVVFAMNLETGDILCRFSGHNSGANGNGEYIIRGVPPGRYVLGAEVLVRSRLTDYGPDNYDFFYTRADQSFYDQFYSANPLQPKATEIAVAAGQTATIDLTVFKSFDPQQDDAFEDNDGFASARLIDPGSYNLRITSGDEDWFKVAAEAGKSLRVLARFTHLDGDLDLLLYDPNGNLVAASDDSLDDEYVVIDNVSQAGDYLVRVTGFGDAANSYTLTVFRGAAPTGIAARETSAGLPREFGLSQNYPNPFWSEAASPALSGETTIKYQLPKSSEVRLMIFDLNGRRVATLESGFKEAGEHVVRWNGLDSDGKRMASSVYLYRLEATSANGTVMTLTKKLAMLK